MIKIQNQIGKKNEVLLSDQTVVKQFEKNDLQVVTKTVEHCYYHGFVKKEKNIKRRRHWPKVALSTCDGLKGVI